MSISLKGFDYLGAATISSEAVDNLIQFFDWGLLDKGNFVNVAKDSVDYESSEISRLKPVNDPRFTDGTVWQSQFKNWVWETGTSYSVDPLVGSDTANPGVSGVYVNDTFVSVSDTGTYSHSIDHRNGRVIFDSPVTATTVIEAEFSYKYVDVQYAYGLTWFEKIQQNSERPSKDPNSYTSAVSSGESYIFPENRVQLPIIGVELTNGRDFKPYQLGGGQYVTLDVLFHCISDDPYMRDHLIDVVSMQNEKTFRMYNSNSINSANAFPINHLGVPNSGAMIYPDLVTAYPGLFLRLKNTQLDSIYSLSSKLHVGTVRCGAEIIVTNI